MKLKRFSLPWLLLAFYTGVVLLFVTAPILVVIIEAFNADDFMSFPPQRLSLRWFFAFFADREFMNSLRLSLELGFTAAVISTVLGSMAGVVMGRKGASTPMLETYLLSPLYVPRVLVGLALLLAFTWLRISGSFATLLLAHVLITLPYTTQTVLVGMRAVHPSIEEAARVLGATPSQTFWRVVFPIIRNSILSGFIFAIIISFSDLYLSLFLSGSQSITLPLRLFNFMEWDRTPLVAAAAAVQIVVILAVILISSRLLGLSNPHAAR